MGGNSSPLRRRLLQALVGTLIIVAGLASYLLILKWRGPAVVSYTRTEWDRLFPFQPSWLYFYFAPYGIAPLLLGLMRPDTFSWFLKRALIVLSISLLVFALIPTHTVRPPIDELGNGWTAQFYRAMIAINDPPPTAAPTMTTLLAWL